MQTNTIENHFDDLSYLLDPTQRHIEPRQRSLGSSIMQVRSVDQEKRSVTALVSTPNVDRYQEMVEPKAFAKRLSSFESNPVLCAGHLYVGAAGEATVIGSWSDLRVTDAGLIGTCTFAATKLGDEYWSLYRDGHMKAFSVGWISWAWEMRAMDYEGKSQKLRCFTDVELIEISCVAIPANRESLVRAASALLPMKTVKQRGSIIVGEPEDVAEFYNKLQQTIQTTVETTVTNSIKKHLNTDPEGPLCNLIQECFATLHGHGTHECEHDEAGTAGDLAAGSGKAGEAPQIKAILRAALQG